MTAWAGLSTSNYTGLIQAGYNHSPNYYGWYEYLSPTSSVGQILDYDTASYSGAELNTQTWYNDSQGWAYFRNTNLTSGTTGGLHVKALGQSSFWDGTHAEWISAERISSGGLVPLAKHTPVNITSAKWKKLLSGSLYGGYDAQGGSRVNIDMPNENPYYWQSPTSFSSNWVACGS